MDAIVEVATPQVVTMVSEAVAIVTAIFYPLVSAFKVATSTVRSAFLTSIKANAPNNTLTFEGGLISAA